jgi:dTDP-4-dehydrorhamnose reductase
VLLNEYAKQKYSAEKFVESLDNYLILRTSILGYRRSGSLTFIEWVLSTMQSKKQIIGFVDAYTSSIDVDSFVEVVFLCIKNGVKGIYNIASSEVYSKYDLIEAIINALDNVDVNLVPSKVSKLSPARASCCGLDVKKIQDTLKISLPTLEMVVENLNIQENYNELR